MSLTPSVVDADDTTSADDLTQDFRLLMIRICAFLAGDSIMLSKMANLWFRSLPRLRISKANSSNFGKVSEDASFVETEFQLVGVSFDQNSG